jgi:ribosomal protein S18 acetylase RimI-like enzyme
VSEHDGDLTAFLVGFCSPALPEEAYIHFLGVAPTARRQGLARRLYEEFFPLPRADHQTVVRAVTSPLNTALPVREMSVTCRS